MGSENRPRRAIRSAITPLPLFGAIILLAAGCGGSSSSNPDGVAANFMGLWTLPTTTTATTFTLACPNMQVDTQVTIWQELLFDHGVLTDLTETSGTCVPPGVDFNIDSKGVVATAPQPDPLTNAAPTCVWVIGNDANGIPVHIDLSFSQLTFTMLPSAGTGTAPRGLLGGAATGPWIQDDGSGTGNFVTVDTCTYSGAGDTFERTTRP